MASGDLGRATPPPLVGVPPKYTSAHYEEVIQYSSLVTVIQQQCSLSYIYCLFDPFIASCSKY